MAVMAATSSSRLGRMVRVMQVEIEAREALKLEKTRVGL
jgi:hypothetical protein